MVDRVYLSKDEKDVTDRLIRRGLAVRGDRWQVARIALARSLQIAEPPDPTEFAPAAQQRGGSEIHAQQMTGEGGGDREDFTDAYRALLSVYSRQDMFAERRAEADEDAFSVQLQAHVRRGLREIDRHWRSEETFAEYMLREVYQGVDVSGTVAGEAPDGDLRERVARILGQIGVGAKVLNAVDGPRVTLFTLELATLDDLDRLRKGLGKLAFALGQGENAITSALAAGERRVLLSVPRPSSTWRTVEWAEVRPALAGDKAAGMALPVCPGTDVLAEPLVFDLADAPHLFVGGTTGAGKSMCLHAILLSLLEGPGRPELILVDPKAVEFTAYAGHPSVRTGGAVTSADAALVVLEDLVAEMDERQERLRSFDARNLAEANERGANIRRVVVVVDELGDLFMTRREIETPLIRLAQKARSSGIHLVLATQRPEAATFPGLLRSNVPSRIALTVQKSAESRIILDEVGAEALLMRGDMLIKLAGKPTMRAHGCRVTSQDIQAGVRTR